MGDVYPLLFLWSSNLLISLIMAIWETERERGRERKGERGGDTRSTRLTPLRSTS